MLNVSEFTIYSVEEDENYLEVEGEVIFDNDHTTAFSITIDLDENYITAIEFEFEPDEFDIEDYKTKLMQSARNFEE